jgi:hypothetical protein
MRSYEGMAQPVASNDGVMGVLSLLGIVGGIALVITLINRWADAQGKGASTSVNPDVQAEREKRAADRREFLKRARRMRAKVRFMFQSGTVNLLPNLHLALTVEAPEGAYDVDVEHHVQIIEIHRFAEGRMIDVYVDPEDREHVVVAS